MEEREVIEGNNPEVKVLLWLDDIREPNEEWLVFSPIEQPYEVFWVKSYTQFVFYIFTNGLPEGICFDHDLGLENHIKRSNGGMSKRKSRILKQLEYTGYDCAKWLVDYCIDNNLPIPKWNIQSANPVGKENIKGLLENYEKFYNQVTKVRANGKGN